eukprot:scaffold36179_cov21-Tisochrysis_lutea.AAC.1
MGYDKQICAFGIQEGTAQHAARHCSAMCALQVAQEGTFQNVHFQTGCTGGHCAWHCRLQRGLLRIALQGLLEALASNKKALSETMLLHIALQELLEALASDKKALSEIMAAGVQGLEKVVEANKAELAAAVEEN